MDSIERTSESSSSPLWCIVCGCVFHTLSAYDRHWEYCLFDSYITKGDSKYFPCEAERYCAFYFDGINVPDMLCNHSTEHTNNRSAFCLNILDSNFCCSVHGFRKSTPPSRSFSSKLWDKIRSLPLLLNKN